MLTGNLIDSRAGPRELDEPRPRPAALLPLRARDGILGVVAVAYNLRLTTSAGRRPRKEAPMSADDLAAALTTGGIRLAGPLARGRPAHPVGVRDVDALRPAVRRCASCGRLTLRFGGDVWWLSYVLIRDALLFVTLGLSMIFFMPNLYLKGGPADHGAACRGRPVLGPGGEARPRRGRRPGRLPARERPARGGLGALHRPPGVRHGGGRPGVPRRPAQMLISTENLDVARPIFWISMVLFGLTAARPVRPVPGPSRPARRR